MIGLKAILVLQFNFRGTTITIPSTWLLHNNIIEDYSLEQRPNNRFTSTSEYIIRLDCCSRYEQINNSKYLARKERTILHIQREKGSIFNQSTRKAKRQYTN